MKKINLKTNLIISAVLLVLITLFIILGKFVSSGFTFGAIICFCLLAILIVYNLVYRYKQIKIEMRKSFPTYLAILYNEGKITKQQFEAEDENFFRAYYKTSRKARFYLFVLICANIGIVISLIIYMFYI